VVLALNPVWGFGATVTAPAWQANAGEENHFVAPHTSECYSWLSFLRGNQLFEAGLLRGSQNKK
jgi:hypothetical protein